MEIKKKGVFAPRDATQGGCTWPSLSCLRNVELPNSNGAHSLSPRACLVTWLLARDAGWETAAPLPFLAGGNGPLLQAGTARPSFQEKYSSNCGQGKPRNAATPQGLGAKNPSSSATNLVKAWPTPFDGSHQRRDSGRSILARFLLEIATLDFWLNFGRLIFARFLIGFSTRKNWWTFSARFPLDFCSISARFPLDSIDLLDFHSIFARFPLDFRSRFFRVEIPKVWWRRRICWAGRHRPLIFFERFCSKSFFWPYCASGFAQPVYASSPENLPGCRMPSAIGFSAAQLVERAEASWQEQTRTQQHRKCARSQGFSCAFKSFWMGHHPWRHCLYDCHTSVQQGRRVLTFQRCVPKCALHHPPWCTGLEGLPLLEAVKPTLCHTFAEFAPLFSTTFDRTPAVPNNNVTTLRAQRLKKIKSRLKFSISIDKLQSRLKIQASPSEFPTRHMGLAGGSLEIVNLAC